MPYRVDLRGINTDTLDRLIDMGALDVELSTNGRLAALMPDSITLDDLRNALGDSAVVSSSPAAGRDAASVWILSPRPIDVGRVRIVPAEMEAQPGTIRLIDAPAFGTGLHPTTALCLEILSEMVARQVPDCVLDIGTGSGLLALAALTLGVPHAIGIDIDMEALRTAAENARLNGLEGRLRLVHGGPEVITGTWPLVLANVLAASLMEMAPSLVRRIGHHGRVVLSGIPVSVEQDVDLVYRRLGMRRLDARSRAGWIALTMQASW
jgi:ribosomal protein L11 methyltransferase